MSKDYGKTRPMSMFLRQTKFFMLCVKPTFVVIDGSPIIRLTIWFLPKGILKMSLADLEYKKSNA